MKTNRAIREKNNRNNERKKSSFVQSARRKGGTVKFNSVVMTIKKQ